MRKLLMIGTTLGLFFSWSPAVAQAVKEGDPATGNGLWDYCQVQGTSYDRGFCDGYILGVARAVYDTKKQLFCIPSGAMNNQLFDVVRNGLRDHPEERQHGSDQLVLTYLHRAFPCPAK